MNKVAIYCRVSSDDQKERDTIENQIEILNTYIEFKEEYEKAGEYLDDGVSGTIPFQDRPAGKQLIEDCKKGLFNSILVWKIDRFGRDTLSGLSAVELLRQYNVEIISVTEPFDLNTPTGRFQFITYLNMAELERNNILDRMFIGATRAAKKGKWLGGIVPYGYFVNKEKYLEINEFEANVVRKIFDLYINEKMTTLEIALYLNNTGIDCNYARRGTGKQNSTTKKSIWSLTSTQRILSSTTYMGIHEYGKRATRRTETIIREVPAIVPIEIFEKAKEIRSKNKLNSKKNSPNRNFLLRRLIKCEECGRTFYGVYYPNKKCVYSCSGKKSTAKKLYGVKCNSLNIVADDIERDVWELCVKFIEDYDDITINLKDDVEIKEIQSSINSIQNNIKSLENEKNNVIKLFRKDLITEKELEDQLKELKTEENLHNKMLEEFKNKLYTFENKISILNDYNNTLKYYKENLENLTIDEKQKVLNVLIKEIQVRTVLHEGELIPRFKIIWNIADLICVPSSFQLSSHTSNEKIPTLYIGKNLYKFIGINLKTFRVKNRISSKDLSKALNISPSTLHKLEKGELKNPYKLIHIYCRHFYIDPTIFIKKYDIICLTLKDKLNYLRLYYGVRSLKEIDLILGTYSGAISQYMSKNINEEIKELIEFKYEEIKKK